MLLGAVGVWLWHACVVRGEDPSVLPALTDARYDHPLCLSQPRRRLGWLSRLSLLSRRRPITMGSSYSSSRKIDKALGPSFPESERIFGLENFGNTCYCNSVLQALYFCRQVREVCAHSLDSWTPRACLRPSGHCSVPRCLRLFLLCSAASRRAYKGTRAVGAPEMRKICCRASATFSTRSARRSGVAACTLPGSLWPNCGRRMRFSTTKCTRMPMSS